MVGDIGIDERINIEKSEHGNQRPDKEQEGGKGTAIQLCQSPEHEGDRHDSNWKQILPPGRRVDFPVWIDEHQILGPHDFGEIKPDYAASHQQTVQQRE